MKRADIDRLRDAELITNEQHGRIVEHFRLDAASNRFLVVVSLLGGLLVVAGVLLLVASNWDQIPPGWKILTAVGLLIASHTSGAILERRGKLRRTREALHVAGAILFLATIALIGQIYHLNSRTPNAWWVWWLGIAPLPWILRSRALHLLSLVALLVAFGHEAWASDGWLRWGTEGWPVVWFALLGTAGYGWGLALRAGRWRTFAEVTERFFLILLSACLVPLAVREFQSGLLAGFANGSELPFWAMLAIATAMLAYGLESDSRFSPVWRLRWGGAFAALGMLFVVLLVAARKEPPLPRSPDFDVRTLLAATGALAGFCFGLLQVRVGVQIGSGWLVNLGMALVATVTLTTYLTLIGTMAHTGLIFVVSGFLLVGFGTYLERKRRTLVRGLHPTTHSVLPS